MSGWRGHILKTVDGGQNWKFQDSNTNETLWSIFFLDENTGWAAGDGGAILKTTTGGETGIEKDPIVKLETPRQLELFQNYPNPFNPSTSIRFGLSEKKIVELKIIDLLGREVRTLTAESKTAGYHDIIWNGTDNQNRRVPSGVYICTLNVDGYRETRKLLLIK